MSSRTRGALPLSPPGPDRRRRRLLDGPCASEESGEVTLCRAPPQPPRATRRDAPNPRPRSRTPARPSRPREGAKTAGSGPTTPRPRFEAPRLGPRLASPGSYLPWAPTPPPRPGCEAPVLSSAEALSLPSVLLRSAPSRPRRPGRRPRPCPIKQVSDWLLFPSLTLGPPPALPGAIHRGPAPALVRARGQNLARHLGAATLRPPAAGDRRHLPCSRGL